MLCSIHSIRILHLIMLTILNMSSPRFYLCSDNFLLSFWRGEGMSFKFLCIYAHKYEENGGIIDFFLKYFFHIDHTMVVSETNSFSSFFFI